VSDYTPLTFPQAVNLGETLNSEWNFKDMVVGDAIEKINNFDDYLYRVSGSKVLYYKTGNSQMTITESDIIYRKPFEYSDDELFNDILVKGYDVTGQAEDGASISTYGRHKYRVSESLIDNQGDADTLAAAYLAEYKDPVLYGSFTIAGDESIKIQESFTFNLTNLNIAGTHKIVGYRHLIDLKNGFTTRIDFGRPPYEPAREYSFLRKNNSNAEFGAYKSIADAQASVAAVDGKIVSFFQEDPPSAGESSEGDIWFDTDDGKKVYVYSNNSWTDAQDGGIAGAIASSLAAHASAIAAIESANKAMTSGNAALVLADGKCQSFYQDNYPTWAGDEASYGDFWYDTDDERLFICSVAEPDSEDDWVTTGEFSAAWDDITGSNKPQDYATANKTYYGTNPPTGIGEGTGDIWISSSGCPFIYSGGTWYRTTWSHVKQDPDAPADNATKNELVRQSSKPSVGSYSAGDMWVDSDDGTPHIHDGTDWVRTDWENIKDTYNHKPEDNADVTGDHDCQNPGDYTGGTPQNHSWLNNAPDNAHHNSWVDTNDTIDITTAGTWSNDDSITHDSNWYASSSVDKIVGVMVRGYDPDGDLEGLLAVSMDLYTGSEGTMSVAYNQISINQGATSYYRFISATVYCPAGAEWRYGFEWQNTAGDDDGSVRVWVWTYDMDTPD